MTMPRTLVFKMKKRAVFIDRDGVILVPFIRERFSVPTSPFKREEFKMFDMVKPALDILGNLGFLRILVTNQPDIAYGYVTREDWQWMQGHVEALPLDDIFICFHTRYDGCDCKKPKPGMILDAAQKRGIDLLQSYMIGDTAADTGAAKEAGVKSILLTRDYNMGVKSDFVAESLFEAALLIRQLERRETP